MKKGDHIWVKTKWDGVTHHGVYCGDGTVIHFDGHDKLNGNAKIRRHSLERFSHPFPVSEISVFEPCNSSLADEIVRKAESFVGESGYNLVLSNCEHFASYCVNGIWKSKQVINKANQTSKSFLDANVRALSKPNIIELARKAAMGQQDPAKAAVVFLVVGGAAAAVLSPAIEKVTEIVSERRNTKK